MAGHDCDLVNLQSILSEHNEPARVPGPQRQWDKGNAPPVAHSAQIAGIPDVVTSLRANFQKASSRPVGRRNCYALIFDPENQSRPQLPHSALISTA